MVEKQLQLQVTEEELSRELSALVEMGLIEKATDEHGQEVYKIREAQPEEPRRGVAIIGDDEDDHSEFA